MMVVVIDISVMFMVIVIYVMITVTHVTVVTLITVLHVMMDGSIIMDLVLPFVLLDLPLTSKPTSVLVHPL